MHIGYLGGVRRRKRRRRLGPGGVEVTAARDKNGTRETAERGTPVPAAPLDDPATRTPHNRRRLENVPRVRAFPGLDGPHATHRRPLSPTPMGGGGFTSTGRTDREPPPDVSLAPTISGGDGSVGGPGFAPTVGEGVAVAVGVGLASPVSGGVASAGGAGFAPTVCGGPASPVGGGVVMAVGEGPASAVRRGVGVSLASAVGAGFEAVGDVSLAPMVGWGLASAIRGEPATTVGEGVASVAGGAVPRRSFGGPPVLMPRR